MNKKMRLLLGAAICLCGVLLAARSLHRGESPSSEAHTPTPDFVEEVFQVSDGELRSLDQLSAAEISATAKQTVIRMMPEGGGLTPSERADLATAFEARLNGFLLNDYNASLRDMVARGWPDPTPAQFEAGEANWNARRSELSSIRIDPTHVEIRTIDRAWIEDPRIDPLKGFRRSIFDTVPQDTAGRAARDAVAPDGRIIEVSVRAVVPNVRGEPSDVMLGYRFTWDHTLDKWRWIQTCLYSRPGEGPFGLLTPV